jgi:hypothetical protein
MSHRTPLEIAGRCHSFSSTPPAIWMSVTDSVRGASRIVFGWALPSFCLGLHNQHQHETDSMAPCAACRSLQDRLLEPILCGGIGRIPPSGDTPRYHPAGQKASAHALFDGCGWAPTVPSPTLLNPAASAEVTPRGLATTSPPGQEALRMVAVRGPPLKLRGQASDR